MPTLLRAATLTNFEQVAHECGLNALDLLDEIGLTRRCLKEPDLLLPASLVGRLLELASQRANEPGFGLRMVATRRLSNLGLLGLLLRDQPTLRHALEALVTHLHTHAKALAISVVEESGLVFIREEPLIDGGAVFPQAIEMAMGSTYRIIRFFMGEGWAPRMVSFRHPAPAHTAVHHRFFGSRVDFGQEFNDIVCSARDLDASNPGADPVMARYTEGLLAGDPSSDTSITDQVRKLVVLLLPRGHCRAEVVAQHMGVDRRTIHNRLDSEGTHFKNVVNHMRCELLDNYLNEGSRSLSEVAKLLGFSELSAFSRWHRQQFGRTASLRRRER